MLHRKRGCLFTRIFTIIVIRCPPKIQNLNYKKNYLIEIAFLC